MNSLAAGYTYEANYDEALKYNFQSQKLREAEGNKAEISIALNNIGVVYSSLENYDRALEYYNEAFTMKAEVNDKFDLDRLLINMASCYNEMKNYHKALSLINQAFKVCGENCTKAIQMEGNFALGISLLGLRKLAESEVYLTESYAIAKKFPTRECNS